MNDETIDLAEIDSEYVKLINRVLAATPEELEKIRKLIEEC